MLTLGKILVRSIDQAGERHAEAPYTGSALGRGIIGQNLESGMP
jgi:hypothetical protein